MRDFPTATYFFGGWGMSCAILFLFSALEGHNELRSVEFGAC
jgi:hypothetical protein